MPFHFFNVYFTFFTFPSLSSLQLQTYPSIFIILSYKLFFYNYWKSPFLTLPLTAFNTICFYWYLHLHKESWLQIPYYIFLQTAYVSFFYIKLPVLAAAPDSISSLPHASYGHSYILLTPTFSISDQDLYI